MKTKNGLPPFFNHKEENSDNGYEAIQDFFLSWTLRCSQHEFSKYNDGLLYEYARKVIFQLIFGENNGPEYLFRLREHMDDSFVVNKVRTWRQWERVDLIAEIDIEFKGKKETVVLNIENKWYTDLGNNQLERSIESTEHYYQNKNVRIENCVIPCDDEKLSSYRETCRVNNFKLVSISELQEVCGMLDGKPTGNDLFDEYWFHF
jgi:hypothetical protein